MKSKEKIKTLLGLSQQEMARLTGVSRSLWSMYEIHQRDIPFESSKVLTDLIFQIQNEKSLSTTQLGILKLEEKKKQANWLKQEHITLLHKIELVKRKIETMRKTRKDCFAALDVVDYLEQYPDNISFKSLAIDVRERVNKSLNNNSSHKLYELELKKESLEMLKLKIEAKIKS